MKRGNVTVRMGAAHWDVTIKDATYGDLHFNLRKMDRHQRGRFHGTFMSSVRKSFRMNAEKAA